MATFTAPNIGAAGTEISSLGWLLLAGGPAKAVIGADGNGIASTGSGGSSVYGFDTASPNHQIVYDYEGAGNTASRAIVGWVDSNNYVYIRHDGIGNRRIYQRLAGVDTMLTDLAPQNIGTRYKLRKAGTTITLRSAVDDSVLVTTSCDAAINGTIAGIRAGGAFDPWMGNVVIQDTASEGGAAVLAPAGASHGHSGGSPGLAAQTPIGPAASVHAHSAEAAALAASSPLAVDGAAHAHMAESPALSALVAAALAIDPAGHGLGDDPPILAGTGVPLIAGAAGLHGMASGLTLLSMNGAGQPALSGNRLLRIGEEARRAAIAPDNRVLYVR